MDPTSSMGVKMMQTAERSHSREGKAMCHTLPRNLFDPKKIQKEHWVQSMAGFQKLYFMSFKGI